MCPVTETTGSTLKGTLASLSGVLTRQFMKGLFPSGIKIKDVLIFFTLLLFFTVIYVKISGEKNNSGIIRWLKKGMKWRCVCTVAQMLLCSLFAEAHWIQNDLSPDSQP